MSLYQKTVFIFSFLLLPLITLVGCKKDEVVAESCYTDVIVDKIEKANGEVKVIGDSWVIEVTGPNYSGRYLACNLPENLKTPNTSLAFDANVFQTPPNMRLAGTPIIITKIY